MLYMVAQCESRSDGIPSRNRKFRNAPQRVGCTRTRKICVLALLIHTLVAHSTRRHIHIQTHRHIHTHTHTRYIYTYYIHSQRISGVFVGLLFVTWAGLCMHIYSREWEEENKNDTLIDEPHTVPKHFETWKFVCRKKKEERRDDIALHRYSVIPFSLRVKYNNSIFPLSIRHRGSNFPELKFTILNLKCHVRWRNLFVEQFDYRQ